MSARLGLFVESGLGRPSPVRVHIGPRAGGDAGLNAMLRGERFGRSEESGVVWGGQGEGEEAMLRWW